MYENINIEQYTHKEKEWAETNSEELIDGYKLPIDEDGDFNPNIYEAMVLKCQSGLFEIKDCRPDYFELVQKSDNALTQEKANQVRSIRSQYMSDILSRCDRNEKQKAIGLDTTESEDTYRNYLLYLQYLRDIPQQLEFPNVEVLTFDKWKETSSSDIVLTEKETESEVI